MLGQYFAHWNGSLSHHVILFNNHLLVGDFFTTVNENHPNFLALRLFFREVKKLCSRKLTQKHQQRKQPLSRPD